MNVTFGLSISFECEAQILVAMSVPEGEEVIAIIRIFSIFVWFVIKGAVTSV